MVPINLLTLFSDQLGLSSALLDVSDKVHGWREKREYDKDPEWAQKELLRQFSQVQSRAYDRVIKPDGDPDDSESESCLKLLDMLVNRLGNRFPNAYAAYTVEVSCDNKALLDLEALQNSFPRNKEIQKLLTRYTASFFQEMSHGNYEMLSRWYSFMANKNLLEKCEEIARVSAETNEKIEGLWDDTRNIRDTVSKAADTGENSKKLLQGIQNLGISLALALAGSFAVWLFEMLLGYSLDPVYLIAVPLCLLISDLLAALVPADLKQIGQKRKILRWPFVLRGIGKTAVFSIFQAIIVMMLLNHTEGGFCKS